MGNVPPSSESNPLVTVMATSGVLNAFGDLLAQVLFEDGQSVDTKRTLTFTFLGAFLVGPALHFWYGSLGKIVTVGGSVGAGLRLGLDQLAFAPVFLATFLSALFAIEGNTDKLPNKLKQDLFPTVVAVGKIWVPFQFLNFRFVPANLQVGAANVIALAWNVYLSWASHKKVPEGIEKKNVIARIVISLLFVIFTQAFWFTISSNGASARTPTARGAPETMIIARNFQTNDIFHAFYVKHRLRRFGSSQTNIQLLIEIAVVQRPVPI